MRELLKQVWVVLEKCSYLKKVKDIIINNRNQNFKLRKINAGAP